MRKFGGIVVLSLWVNWGWAQVQEPEREGSSAPYIIIGALLLLIVIIMLLKRQKRKFNE